MSLIIAYLGERLRKLSRKAHISIARLSAYLNEVCLGITVMKDMKMEPFFIPSPTLTRMINTH